MNKKIKVHTVEELKQIIKENKQNFIFYPSAPSIYIGVDGYVEFKQNNRITAVKFPLIVEVS